MLTPNSCSPYPMLTRTRAHPNPCSPSPTLSPALPLQLAVETALLTELVAYGRGVSELPSGLKLGLKTQPFPNPELVGYQRKLDEELGKTFGTNSEPGPGPDHPSPGPSL